MTNALESSDLGDAQKDALQDIELNLNNPPPVEANIGHESILPVLKLQDEKMRVCDQFTLQIQYHTSNSHKQREATVGNYIYKRATDSGWQSDAVDLEMWAKDVVSRNPQLQVPGYWKWIHLLANHVCMKRYFARPHYDFDTSC